MAVTTADWQPCTSQDGKLIIWANANQKLRNVLNPNVFEPWSEFYWIVKINYNFYPVWLPVILDQNIIGEAKFDLVLFFFINKVSYFFFLFTIELCAWWSCNGSLFRGYCKCHHNLSAILQFSPCSISLLYLKVAFHGLWSTIEPSDANKRTDRRAPITSTSSRW